LPGKSGIIGVHDVGQQAHVVDAKPFQLGMLVADIGRLAALPARDGINVMQRIAVDVRPAFPDGRDQPELDRRDADLFPRFADKRRLQALAIFDAAADRVPMVGSDLLRGRAQAEQHLAIRPDEQRTDGSGDLLLHSTGAKDL
jgi:hypothetical protein